MSFVCSEELRLKAYSLCAKHLGAEWKQVSPGELIISPLCGGLVNELYVCALPVKACPQKVVLRLYGKTTNDIPMQILIVKTLASKNLGPKLYGHFDEGRLEEYLPSSALSFGQMRDPAIYSVVAKKIALMESLNVPINRGNGNFLIDMMKHFCKYTKQISRFISDEEEEKFVDEVSGDVCDDWKKEEKKDIPLRTRKAIKTLFDVEFEGEVEFVCNILDKRESNFVFSNNDLHQNNILLVEESEEKCTLEDRVVLIDYEFAGYNYSGFDVANHWAEWRMNYHISEYPFFEASHDYFPSKYEQRDFIVSYLREKVKSKSEDNGIMIGGASDKDVDELIEYLEPLVMASDLLWSMWAIKSAVLSEDKHFYWEIAFAKYCFYQQFKTYLLEKGALEALMRRNSKL